MYVIHVCDQFAGVYLDRRQRWLSNCWAIGQGKARLGMQVCDFCFAFVVVGVGTAVVILRRSRSGRLCRQSQAWTCRFVTFVVVSALGRGQNQACTCSCVTLVVVAIRGLCFGGACGSASTTGSCVSDVSLKFIVTKPSSSPGQHVALGCRSRPPRSSTRRRLLQFLCEFSRGE